MPFNSPDRRDPLTYAMLFKQTKKKRPLETLMSHIPDVLLNHFVVLKRVARPILHDCWTKAGKAHRHWRTPP